MWGALAFAVLVVSTASVNNDGFSWFKEVTSLPGWPLHEPFPSRMFSGFLNISDSNAMPKVLTNATSMFMHYFLFESEGDPTTDPIVVWWNGGPGATSAWGLFVENGPFLLNDESLVSMNYSQTGIPQLVKNPFRWTKFASIIAFCNPPPVGFSFCEPAGPTGNGTACGTWNDTRVAATNAEALLQLFVHHFPKFLRGNQKILFMGESYAGVYIGETLQWMMARPKKYQQVLQHLDGVALGDACLGSDVLCGGNNGPYSWLMFFYGHGQVSTEIWEYVMSNCTNAELHQRIQTPHCKTAIDVFTKAVGGYYTYNLYDQCAKDPFAPEERKLRPLRLSLEETIDPISRERSSGDVQIPLQNGYWCSGQVFFTYFDRQDVRTAIGVPLNSTFFNADNGEGMNYVYNSATVMPTIFSLIMNNDTVINGGKPVRVWAYDGDADPSVNVFVTQEVWWNFTKSHSLLKTSEWKSWVIANNIVGGSVTEWIDGMFQFVTVRGSGHMVPEYKPAAAFVLARQFVFGKPLPPYKLTSQRVRE